MLDSIARWSLFLLAGLIPLFIIPAAWAGAGQAKLLLAAALVIIALLSWLSARAVEGVMVLPRNLLLFASALLPAAYLVSAVFSHAPAESYASGADGQDTVAAIAILFATLAAGACVLSGNARAVVYTLRALLLGSGAVVIFQILRLFIPAQLSLGGALSGSASSVFGSWHDLAVLCALLVFLASVLWNSPVIARGSRRNMIAALMGLIGLLSFALLIVIGMPDVWYALGALMLLTAAYQWWSARAKDMRSNADALWRAGVSIMIGLLALASGFGSGFIYSHLPQNLQIAQLEVRPSWQGTFMVGEKVFGGGSGLIFGSGPNTFPRAWGLFKPPGVNQTNFWNVDFQTGVGLVPTSFVTAGILGALAWLILFLALVWRAWRLLSSERGAAGRGLRAGLAGGALFLAVYHVLYAPGAGVSLLLFLLMGLIAALGAGESAARLLEVPLRLRSWAGVASSAGAAAVAVLVIAAGAGIARATISDLLVAKSASDYRSGGTLAHSLALIQNALAVDPESDTAHRASVELGILQMQQLIAAGGTTSAADLQSALSRTIQEGLKAVSINSGDYQNWLALATLYQNLGGAGVSGAYPNAIAAYQKAAVANPTNPLPLLGEAQVAAAQNDASSSVSYLNAALLLKPNLAVAYFLRSQIEAQERRFVPAIQDAKTAVSLAQQDPLGWYNLGVIFYASGDYASARLALQQALSLNNSYANALFVLSFTYDKLGDRQDALAAMQEVVKLNPNDPIALQALANLQSVRTPNKPTSSAAH